MPITLIELLIRLGASVMLGGLIGFERERREQPAGLRTHLLVSLASATFMVVSTQFPFHQSYVVDGAVRAENRRWVQVRHVHDRLRAVSASDRPRFRRRFFIMTDSRRDGYRKRRRDDWSQATPGGIRTRPDRRTLADGRNISNGRPGLPFGNHPCVDKTHHLDRPARIATIKADVKPIGKVDEDRV